MMIPVTYCVFVLRDIALMIQCCVCLSSSVRNVLWLNGAS